MKMDKIVIFGSTGVTGLCATQAAVEKGMNVRAFVRDPAKLPDDLRNRVEVVRGDVLNYSDVLKAVKDVSGVCVVLGTRNDVKPTTDLSEGMKNIVKAMKESEVHVVTVCLSAFLFYEPNKVPAMFKDLNADHQREFDSVRESGLKFVAVFPPHIADQPPNDYTIEYDKSPGRVVSKYDLGKFLIDALTQPEHYGKVCGICSKS